MPDLPQQRSLCRSQVRVSEGIRRSILRDRRAAHPEERTVDLLAGTAHSLPARGRVPRRAHRCLVPVLQVGQSEAQATAADPRDRLRQGVDGGRLGDEHLQGIEREDAGEDGHQLEVEASGHTGVACLNVPLFRPVVRTVICVHSEFNVFEKKKTNIAFDGVERKDSIDFLFGAPDGQQMARARSVCLIVFPRYTSSFRSANESEANVLSSASMTTTTNPFVSVRAFDL